VVDDNGTLEVYKQRLPYAPILVALGDPLVWLLEAGMVVLSQSGWETRERLLYERLYGKLVRVERDATLVLPHLPGRTLAALLDDAALGRADRMEAIRLAVTSLAQFHALGYTHADAMAENVMVDLETGGARWFDFETVHDATRDTAWCRADDVRALMATCLLRTPRVAFAEVVDRILDDYGDKAVIPHVAASFASTTQRPLAFHLGQAPLSFESFQEIGRMLNRRLS
jgi:hypothetical protein